jgi:hypothetical protein
MCPKWPKSAWQVAVDGGPCDDVLGDAMPSLEADDARSEGIHPRPRSAKMRGPET